MKKIFVLLTLLSSTSAMASDLPALYSDNCMKFAIGKSEKTVQANGFSYKVPVIKDDCRLHGSYAQVVTIQKYAESDRPIFWYSKWMTIEQAEYKANKIKHRYADNRFFTIDTKIVTEKF